VTIFRRILVQFPKVGLYVLFLSFCTPSVASQDQVRVFTHGQGDFGTQLEDGQFVGRGIDLLKCSMQALGQPFSVNAAAMVRKSRLASSETMDAWFPSIVHGTDSHIERIAYPIGTMLIYWYVPIDTKYDVASEAFKARAKVSAFPGSTPEKILRASGFQLHPGTDDENSMILRLVEGRIDGFLGTTIEGLLKPRPKALLGTRIKRTLYREFEVGIEFMESFIGRHPNFVRRFQAALTNCTK